MRENATCSMSRNIAVSRAASPSKTKLRNDAERASISSKAAREMAIKVPLVVRLEGTNVELGKRILKESGLNVIAADDLNDAAKKVVEAVKRGA